jgi:DNA-binding response OmpR family regulator
MASDVQLKIMVVDDDIGSAKGLEDRFRDTHVDYRTKNWLRQSGESTIKRLKPDVVLWDCTGSSEEGSDNLRLVLDVYHHQPQLPMLLVLDLDTDGPDIAKHFADAASIDLVRSPVNLDEVMHRIRRLMRHTNRPKRVAPHPPAPPAAVLSISEIFPSEQRNKTFPHLALDLYSTESGRLDGKKISSLFGFKLSDLAHLLHQKLPTLSKTPDAPSIQQGLTLFQRIGLALVRLVGSPEGILLWMNAPNPELEGKTPCAVVLSGQGDVVLQMLEDMLVGQPA